MGVIVGKDLLDEKNLFQIYRKCITLLPPSDFNQKFIGIVLFVLVIEVAYFPEYFLDRIELCRSLSELGLGFGSTILGFLIAGFTIFSTLSKPEMFLRLQNTTHKGSGLSYLKVNFFTFVEVFVVYVFYMLVCLAIKIFCAKNGLISVVIGFTKIHPLFGYYIDKQWIANAGYVGFSTLSFVSLLALKSFIFNTYHTVMTSIVWSFNPPKPQPSLVPVRRVKRIRDVTRGNRK